MTAHDEELQAGMILEDRYQIERRIGSGGMGTVYLAQQLELRVPVAVKVLHRERSEDFTNNYRFFREARVAARVIHPNVARVLDLGRTPDGIAFLVMDHLDGEDLAQRLARKGALPWPSARRILRQVARGLLAAHAIGVIHRDVKPSNVFITAASEHRSEQVKLLDFGIAKADDPTRTFGENLTRRGILGTLDYMAPERAAGEPADMRSDIYSVGVMMFEVLTGHKPWSRERSPMRMLMRRLSEEPPRLSELLPNAPRELVDLVRRAMARDPKERFSTLRELDAALRDVPVRAPLVVAKPIVTKRPEPPPQRWTHTLSWCGPPERC